jgi:hypothetical protein
VVITLEILRNISDLHCARCISVALTQILDSCDIYVLLFIVMNSVLCVTYSVVSFLDAFISLRKVTINFIMSLHPREIPRLPLNGFS